MEGIQWNGVSGADIIVCACVRAWGGGSPEREAGKEAVNDFLACTGAGPPSQVADSAVSTLPGQLNDRRSPLGELNWIFTAVTDSIAWDVLPRDLFRRLFRQVRTSLLHA